MINDNYEKEFEDEVYEDEYYDENYDEEELEDESDYLDEEEEEKDELDDDYDEEDEYDNEKKINVSFACDDCDYRWDDVIIKRRGNLEDEEEEFDSVCPMCGSVNLTQI